MLTKTIFDEALKIDYLPAVREQLNNGTILMNRIQRNERDVSGLQWQMVAHYQRNSGIGARADNGTLPTAGYQAYKNPYDDVRYLYGRISLTGPTIASARDDRGAIVRALESEISGLTRDMKKDVNRQMFNDGTSLLCLVNGDPSTGTTLTVDTPGTQYLYDGIVVDIIDASSGAREDTSLTLSTIDSSTQATTAEAIDNAAETDSRVVTAGSTNGSGILPSDSYELMGIKGIVDDGTYVTTLHNLSRTTYPWWKCSTHSTDSNAGTNRDLTLDLMQASLTAVEKNGGKTNLIVTTPELRDAYAALLVADRRFGESMNLDGGFKALDYSGIPLVADPDCTPNTMYFLDTDHLFIFQQSDWNWMEKDGAVLSRVADKDAYEAVLYWYANVGTDRPRAHSFLRDVA
jgi:hypothetical protein